MMAFIPLTLAFFASNIQQDSGLIHMQVRYQSTHFLGAPICTHSCTSRNFSAELLISMFTTPNVGPKNFVFNEYKVFYLEDVLPGSEPDCKAGSFISWEGTRHVVSSLISDHA